MPIRAEAAGAITIAYAWLTSFAAFSEKLIGRNTPPPHSWPLHLQTASEQS
jgi:hypothetical protein